MDDITAIFLTVNKLPEEWVKYHKEMLLKALDGAPVIAVSNYPVDFGGINLSQKGFPINASNIYRQMLRAATLAETDYVAVAEDDTLYPKDHFEYRPGLDRFGYNMSRWGILSWREKPLFFYRHRESNSALIAPRKLLIQCLEERFEKVPDHYGEVGKRLVDKNYGFKRYKVHRFHSRNPIVNFHHIHAIDELEQKKKKAENKALIATEIPFWGRPEKLVKKFK